MTKIKTLLKKDYQETLKVLNLQQLLLALIRIEKMRGNFVKNNINAKVKMQKVKNNYILKVNYNS